jgi:hypothetical protein
MEEREFYLCPMRHGDESRTTMWERHYQGQCAKSGYNPPKAQANELDASMGPMWPTILKPMRLGRPRARIPVIEGG